MKPISRRTLLMASAGILWGWPRPERTALPTGNDAFVVEPSLSAPRDDAPHFASAFIGHDQPLGIAHSPSICQLPNGRLATVWYAGSREGAKDVSVWFSRSGATPDQVSSEIHWDKPQALVDRQSASAELSRYVKKVGNPIIFSDPQGRTWLIYVSIAVGGWSGSSLNVKCSLDSGETWSRSERLVLSPLANISELVRAAPVLMKSGRIAIPIYHESLAKFSELLWLDMQHDKIVWGKTRMTDGDSMLQPTIVPLTEQRALAYHRDWMRRGTPWQETLDAGATWSPLAMTGLPNSDSSVAGLRLSDGSVLLAWNDSPKHREDLTLALSADGTTNWRRVAVLDREAGKGFCYPSMIHGRDGLIHLVYTWNKERIRYLAFNEAWLREQEARS